MEVGGGGGGSLLGFAIECIFVLLFLSPCSLR